MTPLWLRRTPDAADVLVIFGGWAVGDAVFSHLEGRADLLFVSDYRSLDRDLPDLSSYKTRTLIAWSFGIASYGHWQKGRPDVFGRKIAMNGSMTPVNRETGIPPQAMQKTVDTLSEESFQLFLARCFDRKMPRQTIDVPARKAELVAVLDRGDAPCLLWDRIWLSRKDRIFPFASMERAWLAQAHAVRSLDAPHAPFSLWKSWDEIVDER